MHSLFLFSLSFALILSLALVVLYGYTSYNSYDGHEEKLTPFECGFDPLSMMRSPFSTRFFLLVVLFLVFDVEIALLFPVLSIIFVKTSLPCLVALSTFVFVLLMGTFHEWNEGALDWVSN
uniref:NADH-ubiquinone oxidoreductase chain 3 n=1 Tax=Siphonaria gigas TaxID=1087063 RepID=G8HSF9_9GAST|nr:NADH dehydrogenase subunit 3 [Siphonaria gigas]AEQ93916.1 NADH dehydrogenase subunit 3 [Siphonaria gigas]